VHDILVTSFERLLAPARNEDAIRPSPCIGAHVEQSLVHQAADDLRHRAFVALYPTSNCELTHCIVLLADEALGCLKYAPLREGQPMPPQSAKRQAPKQRCSRPSTKNLIQPSICLGRLPFLVANRTYPDVVIREGSPSACHPPPAARDMPKGCRAREPPSCREFRPLAAPPFTRESLNPPGRHHPRHCPPPPKLPSPFTNSACHAKSNSWIGTRTRLESTVGNGHARQTRRNSATPTRVGHRWRCHAASRVGHQSRWPRRQVESATAGGATSASRVGHRWRCHVGKSSRPPLAVPRRQVESFTGGDGYAWHAKSNSWIGAPGAPSRVRE
jgi:hypothetical protein